jgi:hypothetical protein
MGLGTGNKEAAWHDAVLLHRARMPLPSCGITVLSSSSLLLVSMQLSDTQSL